jgi:HNH endonuclease
MSVNSCASDCACESLAESTVGLVRHPYNAVITQNYSVIEYIPGHIKYVGADSGKEKNPLWRVETKEGYSSILMYCEPGDICILCEESFEKILKFENEKHGGEKLSWYINPLGYVYSHIGNTYRDDENIALLSIHQVIMNHYGNGRGTKISSVDHIDRNKLNNTMANLRVATQEEQMLNSKGVLPDTKRERQSNARELPEGITHEMLPKYITYNINVWDKAKGKTRDYFRVEGHPLLLGKSWDSQKSMKVSALEKLDAAKAVLMDLDIGIMPKPMEKPLPEYVSLCEDSRTHKMCLGYERYIGKIRKTKRMTIQDPNFDAENMEDIARQLDVFNRLLVSSLGAEFSLNLAPRIGAIADDEYATRALAPSRCKILALPKNISVYAERGSVILSYAKQLNGVRNIVKITLSGKHDLNSEDNTSLNAELLEKLPVLNCEVSKRFGILSSFMETSEEAVAKHIENTADVFPTFVRIQNFKDKPYLVYNRKDGAKRLTKTRLLPLSEYVLRDEIRALSDDIVKKYGDEYALDMTYLDSKGSC